MINLSSREGTFAYLKTREKDKKGIHPYFTQSGEDREKDGDQYIANMTDGAWAGFKYFEFTGDEETIRAHVRGKAYGSLFVMADRDKAPVATISIHPADDFHFERGRLSVEAGVFPLYFRYEGDGSFDFDKFQIE